jgi:hypothetical protein
MKRRGVSRARAGLIKRRQLAFMLFGAKQVALSRGLLTKRAGKRRTLDGLPRWKKDDEAATRIQRMLRARRNNGMMQKVAKRKLRRDAASVRRPLRFFG